MYQLKTVLSGIFRHRRRNLISCLLLTAVLSVAFCGFYYRVNGAKELQAVSDRYEKRWRIAFRNELQYNPEHPKWSALDIRQNGVPDIFFEPEKMAAYDHPYPAKTEWFEELGELDVCQDYALAYAETAYGFSDEVPGRIQRMLDGFFAMHELDDPPKRIATQHIIVGGDLEAVAAMAREVSTDWKYDYKLAVGTEPGPGECVITDFYSDVYGKGVGDSITLCDVTGEPVTTLKISGIYRVYNTKWDEFVNLEYPGFARRVTGEDILWDYGGVPDCGTPFERICEDPEEEAYSLEHYRDDYYRVTASMIALIHTDYETAYTLYGTPETDGSFEDRHHINNFFAFYNLKERGGETAFEEEVHRILPESYADEFTVYPFAASYHDFLPYPKEVFTTGNMLIRLAGVLLFLIFVIVTAVLVQENGREIGIFLSLGVGEKEIRRKTAGENAILMAVSLLAGYFGSILVHLLLLKDGYDYLEKYGIRYGPTVGGLLFALCALAVSFLVTLVYTRLYIRVHSPIRLIRQNDS